jgi:hypothetical protein
VAPTIGDVLVQLEQLGEEEVIGFSYPLPNVTVGGGLSGLKGVDYPAPG